MLTLAPATLEAIGLNPVPKGFALRARFHSVHVYEVRGLTFPTPSFPVSSGTVSGRSYHFTMGASVNAICQSLANDDFADDEAHWRQERRANPPYLMVHFGPTAFHTFAGTHAIIEPTAVITESGFPDARVELEEWGRTVLPPVFAALAASFCDHDQLLRFVPLDRAFYGVTDDGRILKDLKFTLSATGHASSPISPERVEQRLKLAANLASSVPGNIATFFELAMKENDSFKRFMYFFLTIEFRVLAHSRLTSNRRSKRDLLVHFEDYVRDHGSPLSQADVDAFRPLKELRNELAHGERPMPPADAVRAVEQLANKLQLGTVTIP